MNNLQETKTLTLEGFIDYGNEEIEGTIYIMVKPFIVQWDEAMSLDQVIEELAIDISCGVEIYNDPHLAAPPIRRQFTITSKRNTDRFTYWKRVITIYGENDPLCEHVYSLTEAIGEIYDDTLREIKENQNVS